MLASQQVQSPSHLPGGCRTLWCTCDPHFGCMKPVGLRLSWWIQLSPQQMNPRCHERTCKVIHFAQTAKIFICTWKNLTKNSKVRNGQWSHAAISCSTCDYIPSFKGMPILNVGSISCPVPCHLDQGKAPGKLANWQKYTHTKTGHLGDAGSEITWSQHVLMRDSKWWEMRFLIQKTSPGDPLPSEPEVHHLLPLQVPPCPPVENSPTTSPDTKRKPYGKYIGTSSRRVDFSEANQGKA